MNRALTPFFIAVALVLVTSACLVAQPVPTSASVSPSPVLPQPAGTKTASGPTAAATAVRLNPSPAPSITLTAFPSITPLPTATDTATPTPFGYVPPSTPTVPPTQGSVTPDPVDGATDDWGSQTRCTLMSKTPPDGMMTQPGEQYSATWVLLNSGTRTWQSNEMVLFHIDGPRLAGPDSNRKSLGKDVKVGRTITTPPIWFYAPKQSGQYRSVWGLSLIKTSHVFCMFTINITVP